MKQSTILLFLCTSVVLAQSPKRSSFAPIVGVTRYVLDGNATTGATLGLRYFSHESSSSQFSVFAGTTLRREGAGYYGTEPFIYSDGSQPYRPQPPIYNNAVPASRIAFGLAFAGFDWRRYLADGDIRPYLGIGAEVVSWSATQALTGGILPTVQAGLDVHLNSGFSAFAEGEYAFGMPTLFGARNSALQNLFFFGLGVGFIPQW